MEQPRLEVGIYQIVDDVMMKQNRKDGTGWDWSWADWQRDWMDATPNRFAYRCLPLTIVNQTGWWIKNPVGFTASWRGTTHAGSIDFLFDAAADQWSHWIDNQFGHGIITWNTPFLFRTKPEGSRLLVCGPANYFKADAHPLTAMIESDWMSMSFTMNWKLTAAQRPVRFELGEPLFQAIPLISNACADLERASVTYQKLGEDKEVERSYVEWSNARREFHEQKARGEVKPDEWQKDYFQGRDISGRPAASIHMTKIKPPKIHYSKSCAPPKDADENGTRTRAETLPMNQTPPQDRRTQPAQAARPSGGAGTALKEPAAARARAAQPQGGPEGVMIVTATQDAAPPRPAFDDEWRRWIAENLLLGIPANAVLATLCRTGFDRQAAEHEVILASQSPYLRGAEQLRNRLAKREWQLGVYRKLNRLHPRSGEVERRHKLSRDEFLEQYYSTNRPVIITGMMEDWPALRKWSLDYFDQRFGDREIEVQFGRTGDNYEVEREKFIKKMKFSEYTDLIRSAGTTNDFYLTANNTSHNRAALPELWEDVVHVPEYLDTSSHEPGFFWLGPPGTITPFHHDLTNNFMAQVMGRKRVKLVPSWDLPMMQNTFHCYSRVDGRVTPASPHPEFREPQVVECILGPGEILFLPIGGLHFVEGLDVSATVSFINFVFDNDFHSFYSTYHKV